MQPKVKTIFDDDECQNCKKLESEFEALRIDHLKTQESYSKLLKEKENIIKDTSQADTELRRNRQKIDQLQNEYKNVVEKYQKLQGEFERSTQTIVQLKQINQKIQQEKEELLFVKPVENVEQNQVNEQISQLNQQLRIALKQKEQALSVNTQLTIEIQQLKSQTRNNQPTVQVVQLQRESTDNVYNMEITNLRQRVADLTEALQRQQQEFQTQLQQAKEQITELQNQLEQQDKNIDQQQSTTIQVKQLQQQLKKMDAQFKVLQKQLEYKSQRYDEQVEDINKLQEELENLRTKQVISNIDGEEKDYKIKYKELKEKAQEQEENYKETVQNLEKKLKQYEQYIKQKHGNEGLENIRLKEKLEELRQVSQNGKQIQDDQIQQKIAITNQKKQLDDLTNNLYQNKQRVKELEIKLKQCEEQLISSKIRIAEMMNIAMEFGGTKLLDKFASFQ